MGAILALILPAIPGLVQLAEKLFAGKSTSGTDKLNTVMQQLQVLLTQLASAGLLPTGTTAAAATPDALRGAIEAVISQLKTSGTLGQVTAPGSLYLLQGTVTALSPSLLKPAA